LNGPTRRRISLPIDPSRSWGEVSADSVPCPRNWDDRVPSWGLA
jgi:hypothetical protein